MASRTGRAVRRFARRVAARGANSLGIQVAPLTDRSRLDALLAELHAVTTPLPLVRLGPDHDGGYLVPDDLDGLVACFSPGVAHESGFETDVAERGVAVFMADRSVPAPRASHPLFHFTPKHIGLIDDDATLTLDTWVDASIPDTDGDLLLQMDIEGAEWSVLTNMSNGLLHRFRVMVIELHGMDGLLFAPSFAVMAPVLERILASHMCVHIHRNTHCDAVRHDDITLPRVIEITLLRRDRAEPTGHVTRSPHPLDRVNVSGDDPDRQALPPSLLARR